MSILDLPLEKQKEIAARMGMSHAAWVEKTRKDLADSAAFLKKIKEPPEHEVSKEAIDHMQRKMDS